MILIIIIIILHYIILHYHFLFSVVEDDEADYAEELHRWCREGGRRKAEGGKAEGGRLKARRVNIAEGEAEGGMAGWQEGRKAQGGKAGILLHYINVPFSSITPPHMGPIWGPI